MDLGQSEDIVHHLEISARLPEEFDYGAVIQLQALETNFVRRHPGLPDAPGCGPHQSGGNPTLDVSTCP